MIEAVRSIDNKMNTAIIEDHRKQIEKLEKEVFLLDMQKMLNEMNERMVGKIDERISQINANIAGRKEAIEDLQSPATPREISFRSDNN